jgi:carboxymethylenebutenolidase
MNIARNFPISKGFLVTLVLAIAVSARADDPASRPAPGSVVESTTTYESRGKTIGIERFEPRASGKHPVAVVLHGSGGVAIGGFMFRNLARELASQGYLVVMPHYFDRTGTVPPVTRETMVENFRSWVETVADASSYALGLPNAEPGEVALVGFSLGGYLSLATSTFDPRVKVVVDYFGGLPEPLTDRADKLPPTLILHGDSDTIVPVSEASRVEELLKANHIPFEKKIYEGAGHGFFGASSKDATGRVVKFLGKHMKAPEAQTAAVVGAPS